ncbi:MAG: tryptophan 7-halogenase [Candidatus Acidiferrales bacterium]
MRDVDVAIVGGGPAGTAAALTLLKYSSLRVALLERSAYASFRIGECLSPSAADLLRYLGAEEALTTTEPRPAEGVAAAWGSPDLRLQDFLFTGRGPGWHVDRRRFDQTLANLVCQRGGLLLTQLTVAEIRRSAKGAWRLLIRQGAGKRRIAIKARFVIDATGKRAVIARGQSAKFESHDRLIGISGLYHSFNPGAHSGFTLVEAVPSGWWYTAQLSRSQMLAVFMTDADLARRYRYRDLDSWNRNLASTLHTCQRLQGGRLCNSLSLHAAYTGRLRPVVGPGWIAAGDAAVSFDPLASMGIGYALLSGIEAGRVAHNVLTGSGVLAPAYAERVSYHFAHYLQLRAAYYRMEKRWSDQPFWRRRHNTADTSHLPSSSSFERSANSEVFTSAPADK